MFPSDTDFESKVTLEYEANSSGEDLPFHILLPGNWSGDASKAESSKRKPLVVDRDNFEEVMRRLNVGLTLDLNRMGGGYLELQFGELDDFHPDNLFRRIPVFDELRDLRRRLLNPDSFDGAAAEVRSWFSGDEAKADAEPAAAEEPEGNAEQAAGDSLLDQILSQKTEPAATAEPAAIQTPGLSALIGDLVRPYLVRTDENEQAHLLSVVDDSTSDLMRKILHHPRFQELESAWRGLYFLVRRIETDAELKFFVLDISKEELSSELKSVDDLTESAFYRWLVGETIETPGGLPWAAVCANYTFGLNIDDVAALMRLARLAGAAEAPFIAHVEPEAFGAGAESPVSKVSADTTEGKLWSTLRGLPESNYLGLSPVRFLARLPYGAATDQTEAFSFEEVTDDFGHESYCWANPAFACALLLARCFRLYGWDMDPNLCREIEGLPLHLYRQNGETAAKPAAEFLLTERLAGAMLEQGLMPLLSFRESDRVQLARFQSVADPLQRLAGRWDT